MVCDFDGCYLGCNCNLCLEYEKLSEKNAKAHLEKDLNISIIPNMKLWSCYNLESHDGPIHRGRDLNNSIWICKSQPLEPLKASGWKREIKKLECRDTTMGISLLCNFKFIEYGMLDKLRKNPRLPEKIEWKKN
jgi:hypothetical protein